MPDAAAHALAADLSRLVVKDHVSLGGLAADARSLALAWAWAGLPQGAVLAEPAINAELKAQLAGPLAWLGTDHVELRRWLVDGGWLLRDGWGREYRAAPGGAALHAGLVAALLQLLDGADTARWTRARRQALAEEREARRRRWAPSTGACGLPG